MANFWQTLRGSFSAVSKPNVASTKYSFESSWRDLQGLHAFAPLSIQNFSQVSSNFFAFSQFCFQNFIDFFQKFSKLSLKCNSRILISILWNSSIFYEKVEKIQKTKKMLDYQVSWDFVAEIVEFFRVIFQKLEKKLELEQNPF